MSIVTELKRRNVFRLDHGFYAHWFLGTDPVFQAWRDDPDFLKRVEDMRATAAAQRQLLNLEDVLP